MGTGSHEAGAVDRRRSEHHPSGGWRIASIALRRWRRLARKFAYAFQTARSLEPREASVVGRSACAPAARPRRSRSRRRSKHSLSAHRMKVPPDSEMHAAERKQGARNPVVPTIRLFGSTPGFGHGDGRVEPDPRQLAVGVVARPCRVNYVGSPDQVQSCRFAARLRFIVSALGSRTSG